MSPRRVPGERAPACAERRADYFLEHRPSPAQTHATSFEACHVEQIRDEPVHAKRLFVNRLDNAAVRSCRRAAFLLFGKHRRKPDDRGQWRAQGVRDRRQKRIAKPLGLHVDERVLRDFHVVNPFQSQRDLRGERIEHPLLLGTGQVRDLLRHQRKHAACAHRRLQRQVQRIGCRQCIGATSGGLLMVVDPLPDIEVERLCVEHHGRIRLFDFLPYLLRTVRQQNCDAHVEHFADVPRADLDDLPGRQRRTQLARHCVHGTGAAFAHRRDVRLTAQAGSQMADCQ